MPWASNSELPVPVRNALPDRAQALFRAVANSRIASGASEVQACRFGWDAVRKGYKKPSNGGRWVPLTNSDKLAKADVEYRNGSNVEYCSLCVKFTRPSRCVEVAGTVSPGGLCTKFSPAQPRAPRGSEHGGEWVLDYAHAGGHMVTVLPAWKNKVRKFVRGSAVRNAIAHTLVGVPTTVGLSLAGNSIADAIQTWLTLAGIASVAGPLLAEEINEGLTSVANKLGIGPTVLQGKFVRLIDNIIGGRGALVKAGFDPEILLALARLRSALMGVTKYSPNQPRDPKGKPTGGQWSVIAGRYDDGERAVAGGPSVDAAEKLYKQGLKEPLTRDEKEVVRKYTEDDDPDVNKRLRADNDYYSTTTEGLDDVLGKAALPEDIVAYRGVSMHGLVRISKYEGGTFIDRGYMSTSIRKRVASDFGGYVDDGSWALLEVRLPKGSSALALDGLGLDSGSETEVLVHRNAKFKVVSVGEKHAVLELQNHGVGKYSPNQPRDPKGTSTGGQWTPTHWAAAERERDIRTRIAEVDLQAAIDRLESSLQIPNEPEWHRKIKEFLGTSFARRTLAHVLVAMPVVATTLFIGDTMVEHLSEWMEISGAATLAIETAVFDALGVTALKYGVDPYVLQAKFLAFVALMLYENPSKEAAYSSGLDPEIRAALLIVQEALIAVGPRLAALAKYSPNQPRDPKGKPTGGQWASTQNWSIHHDVGDATDLYDEDVDPSITEESILAELTPEQLEQIRQVEEELANSVPTNAPVADGGFVNPDGTYTEERQRLHAEILNELFEDDHVELATPAPGEKPTIVLLGGRPGAGKTTALHKFGFPFELSKFINISADIIQTKLPGYTDRLAALFNQEAQDISAQAERIAVLAGVNILYDATMKSTGPAVERTKDFIKAGYDVESYFIHTSPQTAALRSVHRFTEQGKEGRYVPPRVALSAVTNEQSFDAVRPYLKRWALYDNNADFAPRLVASGGMP